MLGTRLSNLVYAFSYLIVIQLCEAGDMPIE